ncbi:hypothetical protein FI667_g4605, partial [Globisporangium splendens]
MSTFNQLKNFFRLPLSSMGEDLGPVTGVRVAVDVASRLGDFRLSAPLATLCKIRAGTVALATVASHPRATHTTSAPKKTTARSEPREEKKKSDGAKTGCGGGRRPHAREAPGERARVAQRGKGDKVQDVKSSNWPSVWGGSEQETDEKLLDFYHSTAFNSKVDAVAGANETLKPLRKYFSFVAVTDRPRIVEKQTREWLDAHFSGVFDKLVFVDDDKNIDDVIRHKKDIYEDVKSKVVIGSDPSITPKAAEDVDYAVLVGSVPWAKAGNAFEKLLVAEDWSKAKDELQKIIKDLDLKPVEKVHAGPKLARFTDDLVAVSTRKPAAFYANIINSKFTSQKQETIRLQASEAAITTAIQAAEMLRIQKNATITKISTRYVFRRAKGNGGHRVPKLELILQRIPRE